MVKGLVVWNKGDNNSIVFDADNAFWGIIKNSGFKNDDLVVPRKLLSLYEKYKDRLDKEFYDFRFSQELSAIYIDPTDRCNARCPYCYIPAEIREFGRSMTKSELTFILEKIRQYFYAADSGRSVFANKNKRRKPVIIFHASEPLLVKEIIFDAISKYSRFFKFGLQTNATLMEKADADFLKKYRVGVGISLDSSLPSINNRLRFSKSTGGNFAMAVKSIEWFNGYEGLNIIATVTKLNVEGLPKLVKFLHSKRVPCVLLNPIRITQKNSRFLKPDVRVFTGYFIEAVEKAVELSRNSNHKIIVGNFANVILAIVAPVARRLMCDISPCGGGRCFFTITASGNMIPCGEFIGLKGFTGGNIFRDSVPQAMQSAPFRKIRARVVEGIAECRDCLFRNVCGAPCPAELHALGNMNQKSVFCEFYKEVIKYAFEIIAEGKEEYCLRNEGLKRLNYEYRL